MILQGYRYELIVHPSHFAGNPLFLKFLLTRLIKDDVVVSFGSYDLKCEPARSMFAIVFRL